MVELLIVFAIIAVLVGMIVAAYSQIHIKAIQTQTRVEISQLDDAVANFKARFKVYPPSMLFLSNRRQDYNPQGDVMDTLRSRSLAWIMQIWPDLDWNSGIDWSGGINTSYGPTVLQGDQCLVFFLGGIPGPDGAVTGFSTNKRNPTQTGGDRVGPFFTFETSRLFTKRGGVPFYSYQDPWVTGTPYVYFSSGRGRNGYNDGDAIYFYNGMEFLMIITPQGGCVNVGSMAPTDHNASGIISVAPYYWSTTNVTYSNPDTFQIISAGQDGQFGVGGRWNPVTGAQDSFGRDDQSNFSDRPLGIPAQ
jgi:general secretion pathway protein G